MENPQICIPFSLYPHNHHESISFQSLSGLVNSINSSCEPSTHPTRVARSYCCWLFPQHPSNSSTSVFLKLRPKTLGIITNHILTSPFFLWFWGSNGKHFFLQKRIHRSSQFQRTPEERQFGRNFLASELRLREDDRSRRAPSAQQGDLQLFFFPKSE